MSTSFIHFWSCYFISILYFKDTVISTTWRGEKYWIVDVYPEKMLLTKFLWDGYKNMFGWRILKRLRLWHIRTMVSPMVPKNLRVFFWVFPCDLSPCWLRRFRFGAWFLRVGGKASYGLRWTLPVLIQRSLRGVSLQDGLMDINRRVSEDLLAGFSPNRGGPVLMELSSNWQTTSSHP